MSSEKRIGFDEAKQRCIEVFKQIADLFEITDSYETSVYDIYDVTKEIKEFADDVLNKYAESRRGKSISAVHAYRILKEEYRKKYGEPDDRIRAFLAETAYTFVVAAITANRYYEEGYRVGVRDGLRFAFAKGLIDSGDITPPFGI